MTETSIIVTCSQCNTKNRIPENRIKDNPVCGKCKTPLPKIPVFKRPVVVTDATFDDEVLSHPGPVLLDFWASWCAPCGAMAPVMERLAGRYSGRVKITKLNVDQNPITAAKYNVLSLPTLLFINSGKVVGTAAGALPEKEIEDKMKYYLRV